MIHKVIENTRYSIELYENQSHENKMKPNFIQHNEEISMCISYVRSTRTLRASSRWRLGTLLQKPGSNLGYT